MGVENVDDLGEIGERPGQTVDLVDHHDIDPAGLDVGKQLLEGGSLHRAAGNPTIVVAGSDQPPTLAGLTLDVGLAGLALGIERVEFLLQSLLGRFAGVDRAMRSAGMLGSHSSPPWLTSLPFAAQKTVAPTSGRR